jgi:hypothetical protein
MQTASSSPALPTLKPQEIPFDHPDSKNYFVPGAKPLLSTPAALELYGDAIPHFLTVLQALACVYNGIDYLQVFTDPSKPEELWFIEDGDGGGITAILPSEY